MLPILPVLRLGPPSARHGRGSKWLAEALRPCSRLLSLCWGRLLLPCRCHAACHAVVALCYNGGWARSTVASGCRPPGTRGAARSVGMHIQSQALFICLSALSHRSQERDPGRRACSGCAAGLTCTFGPFAPIECSQERDPGGRQVHHAARPRRGAALAGWLWVEAVGWGLNGLLLPLPLLLLLPPLLAPPLC